MPEQKITVLTGDARTLLRDIPDASVQCCITSPPYFNLRDYHMTAQIGLEASPAAYIMELVALFREVQRILCDDGILWLNLGDSYNAHGRETQGTRVGYKQETNRASAANSDARRSTDPTLKEKDLLMIPARVALALQEDGWYLRSDIIFVKPNPMPESVTDRPTSAHEHVFLLTKQAQYFYNAEAVQEVGRLRPIGNKDAPIGRNLRNVWTIAPQPVKEAHFATMPLTLAERCVLAGSRVNDLILDPFGGAGTTAVAALKHHRRAILIELNPEFVAIAERRIEAIQFPSWAIG
jgi:DNA modification methylase